MSSTSQNPPNAAMGIRAAAAGRPAGAQPAKKRAAKTQSKPSGENGGGNRQTMSQRETLRFYTDDAPGLKIGPTMVLMLSLLFIGFVVLLHIYGKMTRSFSS